jgi:phosphatidylserine decarboxylase
MGNISLYNRLNKQLENEIVSGKSLIDFIYGTKPGILLGELILKKKFFSVLYGNLLKRPASKKKIAGFIRQHNLNIDEILDPPSSFASFNDFFIRRLKPGARPINTNPEILISPADARLSVYNIKNDTVVPVKGKKFTLYQLTNDQALSEKYLDGLCLVFRLAPPDYHRLAYIDNGIQEPVRKLGNYYHSVNPLALESNLEVFAGNYRELCVLKTENFGDVLDIDVGAMGVSKIIQYHPEGGSFMKGEEKGYFEFGGSTTILIFQKDKAIIDQDIMHYSEQGIETLVRYGSAIGRVKETDK